MYMYPTYVQHVHRNKVCTEQTRQTTDSCLGLVERHVCLACTRVYLRVFYYMYVPAYNADFYMLYFYMYICVSNPVSPRGSSVLYAIQCFRNDVLMYRSV